MAGGLQQIINLFGKRILTTILDGQRHLVEELTGRRALIEELKAEWAPDEYKGGSG